LIKHFRKPVHRGHISIRWGPAAEYLINFYRDNHTWITITFPDGTTITVEKSKFNSHRIQEMIQSKAQVPIVTLHPKEKGVRNHCPNIKYDSFSVILSKKNWHGIPIIQIFYPGIPWILEKGWIHYSPLYFQSLDDIYQYISNQNLSDLEIQIFNGSS
jgi:hypothetical protein